MENQQGGGEIMTEPESQIYVRPGQFSRGWILSHERRDAEG